MAKSSNSEFKEIINSVENKLSFITVNEKTIGLLKNDKKFDELFCNMLETLVSLEKKLKIKDLKSTNLINAYKSIMNKDYKGESIKFNDAIDIDDQLHYIDVYLINTFGQDFIQQNNNKVEGNEEVVETKIVNGEEVHNFSNTNQQGNNFNAEEFLKNNNVTVDAVADQLVNQQAQYLLRKDIMENKVFKFDSKPKVVVWLKMLNNILFFLFAAFSFVLCVLQWTTTYVSSIDGKYGYISGDVNPFIIIGIVILLLYSGAKLFSEIKYFKNENFKYTVKLSHIFLVSMIFIMFLIQFIGFLKAFTNAESLHGTSFGEITNEQGNKYFGPFDSNTIGTIIHTNTLGAFEIIRVEYIFIIMIISTFGVLLLNSIILFTIKPRVDFNRMQQLVNQYIQDIKSGKISSESLNDVKGNNPFGGMFF